MAEDDDDSSKTEEPTGKKLGDARSEGNLPLSRDLTTWIVLLGIVFCISTVIPNMMPEMMTPMAAMLANAGEITVEKQTLGDLLAHFISTAGLPTLVILLIIVVFTISASLLQTGPIFNTSLIKMKWEKLNPIQGIKNLFSVNSLVELVKSVFKLLIIGFISYRLLEKDFYKSEMMTGMENIGMVRMTQDLSNDIIFAVFLAFTIIALVDVLYQRYTYFKNLRMTKQEVKEEYRQSEGDPHIKARLRNLRMEKARKRMMSAVPNADVIITNPTHFAVALKYEVGKMQAPVVLAKGADLIAAKIREIAEKHDIPIISNPPLARALFATVEIDQEVPPTHYRAVAEVISYVYRLKKPGGMRWTGGSNNPASSGGPGMPPGMSAGGPPKPTVRPNKK